MRPGNRSKMSVIFLLLFLLLGSTGCGVNPATPQTPAKQQGPVYAMADMQKILESHPERTKLRQMEQALALSDGAEKTRNALIDAAKAEFETAMKIRQNQDQDMIEKRQAALAEQLTEERRQFIDTLEAEYRPLLFNIELKLKSLQNSSNESQALQQEKTRLENERQQKLKQKEDELAARFQREMNAYAQQVREKSETYAQQWMDDRMRELEKPVMSPEQEKQRQEIVVLSGRIMQEARTAVAKVAEREKIDVVWLKPAVRKPVKDITELVIQEIGKAK